MRAQSALRTALASVDHNHQMSFVDHLDEFRTRLIVVLAVVGAAFAVCFWQNHQLLRLIDAPLSHATLRQTRAGDGVAGSDYLAQKTTSDIAIQVRRLATALNTKSEPVAVRHTLTGVSGRLTQDARNLRTTANSDADKPITLGITEPFNTTIGVTLIFALIVSLPVILLQIYGFFMPAVDAEMRRRMRPVLVAVPGLFIVGVAFGYIVVLPAAVRFLQNFNASQFTVLVQASQYYHFAATILLAMGLVFEVPVMIVALTQAGAVTPRQLRKSRKLAAVVCAAIGAFLPGDALTMLLEALPLYCLFEIGIAISSVLARRQRRHATSAGSDPRDPGLRTSSDGPAVA
jgi:sec-independent protein translocase protein TatC